ncbi:Hpt domain-containing protein [candidate division KSB1 bacterium]|nr:MAG: Hpt domain-containing protein [candidate division KSB1 bacterium]
MPNPKLHMVVDELKGSYLKSLTGKLAALTEAAAIRNYDSIILHGHQLKGSGKSYGFAEVSSLGAQIEDAGQCRQGFIVDALIIELDKLVRRLLQDFSMPENS